MNVSNVVEKRNAPISEKFSEVARYWATRVRFLLKRGKVVMHGDVPSLYLKGYYYASLSTTGHGWVVKLDPDGKLNQITHKLYFKDFDYDTKRPLPREGKHLAIARIEKRLNELNAFKFALKQELLMLQHYGDYIAKEVEQNFVY